MTLDFIGIGAQKAATTWLFRCMEAHPDIHGATQTENKELNFFNHNYYKGYLWYHTKFQFGKWKTGEYSTLYLSDRSVPQRVFEYNPDIKLIVSLRNPIDRAFSHHLHLIKEGNLPKNSYTFSVALQNNPSYIELGKYGTHINHFLEWFNKRCLHVVLFEDIVKNPKRVLNDIFNFIGVDADFLPTFWSEKIYIAHTYRSHKLNKMLDRLSDMIRRFGGETSLAILKQMMKPAWIRRYNKIEIDEKAVPPLTNEDRKILSELFFHEVELTEKIVGRNLSNWRK